MLAGKVPGWDASGGVAGGVPAGKLTGGRTTPVIIARGVMDDVGPVLAVTVPCCP